MTDLCLILAVPSLSSLSQTISQYTGRVPYIEARLDYLEQPDIPPIPLGQGTDFIATCRPLREGGRYRGEEADRLKLLQKAAHSGFAWLDLEHDVQDCPPLPAATRIVRSYHCFGDSRQDVSSLYRRVQQKGGDVSKIAVSVGGTAQLVSLLRWMESNRELPPHIVIGMGDFGQASRFLGGFLGNFWTYVVEDAQAQVAPGQLSYSSAVECYRLPSWKTAPPIFGVLGNPVAHSLSPDLHNRLFQHYDWEGVYFPFLLDEVATWMDYVNGSALDFRGFSVTLPFKSDVVPLVRVSRSPLQSLNTLTRRNLHWEGANTDYQGFLHPLKARRISLGKRALVLGNGGVAHTVVAALQDRGAAVTVVGRDPDRVTGFARQHGCGSALFSDLPLAADLCVNTTPVGQYPQVEASPLREDQLHFEIVYDLVYHPEETRLLKLAHKMGLQTISGMDMFIEQAALQFESWTGLSPERPLMKEIVGRLLG